MENRLISRNVWISTRNTGVKLTELKFTSKKSVSGIDGNSVCFPFLPPATKLRQGNVVIMFTGGFCQGNPRTETPLDRDPLRQRPLWTETHQIETPRTETPMDRDPLDRDPLEKDPAVQRPPGQRPPGQRPLPPLYGKERAVRILLECILVFLSIMF